MDQAGSTGGLSTHHLRHLVGDCHSARRACVGRAHLASPICDPLSHPVWAHDRRNHRDTGERGTGRSAGALRAHDTVARRSGVDPLLHPCADRGVRGGGGRGGGGWILFSILAPIVAFAAAAVVAPMFGAPRTDFRQLGVVNFLPYLGIGAWLLWLLSYGIGEETGWRGFALPRLQATRSALTATLLLSVPWAVWHVPSLLYLGNIKNLGILLPGFFIGLVVGGIVYTWLFNSTGGSVLMVALLHASLNFVTASRAGEGANAAVVSMAFVVWGILVILLFKPANLSRAGRQVAARPMPAPQRRVA